MQQTSQRLNAIWARLNTPSWLFPVLVQDALVVQYPKDSLDIEVRLHWQFRLMEPGLEAVYLCVVRGKQCSWRAVVQRLACQANEWSSIVAFSKHGIRVGIIQKEQQRSDCGTSTDALELRVSRFVNRLSSKRVFKSVPERVSVDTFF